MTSQIPTKRYAGHRSVVLGDFLIVLIAAFLSGCGKEARNSSSDVSADLSPTATPQSREAAARAENLAFVEQIRPGVEAFCGNCHAMPRPEFTARSEWVEEVNQGFMLYGESGRNDLQVPNYDDVLRFFQYQAPDAVSLPDSILTFAPCSLPLRRQGVRFPGPRPPGVTNVRWLDLGMEGGPSLIYCDIGTGAVMAHRPDPENGSSLTGERTRRLATLLQPVHTEPCDLNADGAMDLVVADIGEFNANDSDLGRVIWLRRVTGSDKFESVTLLENISRVSDVQPADFDSDGDTDLMVAIFGWRKTGQLILLENEGIGEDGVPRFEQRTIDPRHGFSHVEPCDFNSDGKLDFVALVSQEHEVIEVFLNQGDGEFRKELIWAAPDPAYGSSGIDLVDMDLDGDLDVLYTNGDSFDRGPKPHHSVQWLENRGQLPFEHHHLCHMPGVLNARAGDFDGDGDMDVVAASLLSGPIRQQFKDANLSSVVMMIQESPGVFVPTQLERSSHLHLSIAVDDFNDDGTKDIAIGTYVREEQGELPDLSIWWNR